MEISDLLQILSFTEQEREGERDRLYYIRKTLCQVGEAGVEGGMFVAWVILKINRSS